MKYNNAYKHIHWLAISLMAVLPFFLPGHAGADVINARAAVVIDGSTGRILFGKNPNTRLQPASTTKLVTAMVVLDRIDPGEMVTISKHAATTPSVTPRLRAGEQLSVRDLLNLALIRSVNSAAVALAEAVSDTEDEFVELMNNKVIALGAENTKFINASGLPGEGQHITAYDLTFIMKEALRYPVIREIINTRDNKIYTENGRGLSVRNTNHLLWNDEDVVGGKTGFTRSAGHCFVFAVQKGEGVLISSILGERVRGHIWGDSGVLLQTGEDVLANRKEPELYYTADAEDPIKVVTSKKPRRAAAKKQLASSKYAKDKNKSEAAPKKQAKRKLRARQKENLVGVDGKKATGRIS
jgi:D-alanyl-D-alanine carboxypeptidase (penicillin-binding protein 5/6)